MTEPGLPAAKAERAALSRDLADFLIELSIAIHRYAMYPDGHPSLWPSAEGLERHLEKLLVDRGNLSLGVARKQLVIEGVATESKNPVLSDLAGRLHRHHLGAITFRRGVLADELEEMLKLVAVEADRVGEPLGLRPLTRLTEWPHVKLYPLTYDRLQLLDEKSDSHDEDATSRSARTRAAQLWVGLARAAMAAEERDIKEDEPPAEPSVVAQAIENHPKDSAYEQVIVGYMLQIAEELKGSGGQESVILKQRVSKLVSTLEPETMNRLLEMGGDGAQRRQFMLNASQGMSVDAVVDLVRAASETDQQTVSHSMLRMLQKLATHAQVGEGRRRNLAESSVRDQVASLIRGWSLVDPNPDGYRQALGKMATSAPVFTASAQARYAPEAKRLLEMALEVNAYGVAVQRAIDELMAAGRMQDVVDALDASEAPPTAEHIWQRMATPVALGDVLAPDAVDAALLDLFVGRMGIGAAGPMLEALAGAESRQKRRLLLDKLVKFGTEVAPACIARLGDERWYVRRNMLNILAELPELPPDFSAVAYLDHADERVRREALRILIRVPATRERAIARGLGDPDDRNARVALSAALEGCPATSLALVVPRALSGNDSDLRVLAIRVLAASGQPIALNALLRIAAPRKSFVGSRLPAKSPEVLAAITALRRFPSDERAADIVAQAAASKDPDFARAAGTAKGGRS